MKPTSSKEVTCKCKDWQPGIDSINGPIILQSIRSGGAYEYKGKTWAFCPWCGSKLKQRKSQ